DELGAGRVGHLAEVRVEGGLRQQNRAGKGDLERAPGVVSHEARLQVGDSADGPEPSRYDSSVLIGGFSEGVCLPVLGREAGSAELAVRQDVEAALALVAERGEDGPILLGPQPMAVETAGEEVDAGLDELGWREQAANLVGSKCVQLSISRLRGCQVCSFFRLGTCLVQLTAPKLS